VVGIAADHFARTSSTNVSAIALRADSIVSSLKAETMRHQPGGKPPLYIPKIRKSLVIAFTRYDRELNVNGDDSIATTGTSGV